jgi:hypothetical protein
MGVKKPAKAKNNIKAAITATAASYDHAVGFETSGSLTTYNSVNPPIKQQLPFRLNFTFCFLFF